MMHRVKYAPYVSVITPSFNQAPFLADTIQSVLVQTYPNIEYIVIDGGSTDGSVDIIQCYADRLAHWVSEPDRGQAHAINKGLAVARGDIIGWLNSDDVYFPDTVDTAVETFADSPLVDVVYGRLVRIDAAGAPIPTPLLPKDRLTLGRDNAIGECIVNQPGSFWRREVMERVGYINEDLQYALDHEYWIRMVLAGAQFRRLDCVMAQFRLSRDSKTVGHTANMAREQFDVLERFLADPTLAQKLQISPQALARQADYGRAVISLFASQGYIKTRQWREAVDWWFRALRYKPTVMFEPRWRALATASLQRRLALRRGNGCDA